MQKKIFCLFSFLLVFSLYAEDEKELHDKAPTTFEMRWRDAVDREKAWEKEKRAALDRELKGIEKEEKEREELENKELEEDFRLRTLKFRKGMRTLEVQLEEDLRIKEKDWKESVNDRIRLLDNKYGNDKGKKAEKSRKTLNFKIAIEKKKIRRNSSKMRRVLKRKKEKRSLELKENAELKRIALQRKQERRKKMLKRKLQKKKEKLEHKIYKHKKDFAQRKAREEKKFLKKIKNDDAGN